MRLPTLQQMRDRLSEVGYKNSVSGFDKNPNNPAYIKHLKLLYWDLQESGYFFWYYSCRGKNRFGTAWDATKAAYRQTEWRGKEYDPYYCKFCGKYHIGRHNEFREYLSEKYRKIASEEFEKVKNES